MSDPEKYEPGPADRAWVKKEGEDWTLVLVRELRHPPARVWEALTDPAELSEWAPFDTDRNLGAVGPVKLTTVGAPTPLVSETQVTRADAPRELEYSWGGNDIRWELEPLEGGGTRLTLWHNIDRGFIALAISAALSVTNFDILRSLSWKSKVNRSSGLPYASRYVGSRSRYESR